MLLVLTTAPHFIAAWYAQSLVYKTLLCISTLLSMTWHCRDTRLLAASDHLFAALVCAYEIYASYQRPSVLISVLLTNALVAAGNRYVVYLDETHIVSYEIGHSLWHCLSVAKAIYLALRI
jgi:hypothetical protein